MTFQDDDEVVISGIGGKFPEAGNVADLAKKLFAGESLVTKDPRKLTKGFYENLPEYNGKTQDNAILFDNTFFGIAPIVSTAMDPLTCQILQRTFEAVIDAGINPSELRGTNASVFSGSCHSDSDLEWATDTRSGYGIMGRNRCMNSNRISYWLDLNGTSVSTDSGWTNGLSNLFLGWRAIKSGKCDTAIVSTASQQCHALITIQFKDFGILSPDGISRTFDDSANGFGRSSAVVVLVLQRARCARRNYATIGHIYSTCFGNREGIINKPTQREWETLFRDFYDQSGIDVNDVNYIEAHGSSKREEDAEELNAITEVFCKNRKSPLLVGCVKSNLGHTEASSSFCGIVKSIISLENSLVPQNLHYKNPNSLCPGLAKGQIKVVDKNTPLPQDGWIGVNCHGYGGTYAHIVLKANPKTKSLKYDNIPRLVLLADRTNDYIEDLLEKVESAPFDVEFIGLLHEIHSRRVEKYLGRGYTILPKPENPVHEHQAYGEDKRPVWFIFSGMGSQWPKMGRRLMDLPLFRESIEKSHKLLEAKGLDLIHIITTDDDSIFDNILHSFVGIAAIQVALVDVLRALNINADGFIGHSVGELGCAYADNCFTAEQMVLAAYYRGKASTETELVKGSMAAVGKGYNDIKEKLPEGVEVACHNSADSCTLSGPVELIHKFVAELKEQGIFAKSVNVSNIAYHSQYIRPAAPKLLAYLKEVVKNPKLRSSKWISTSNPESQWDTEVAKYCSAEYHTNNLLSSVLFEEGSKHIPKNAICIEIAPHGLLQAILKRSLGENVTNIPLTSRSAEDPLIFLLQAIGKMYMAGIDPNIVNLYPKIEYPVSRGTHVLHYLVHWHEQLSATVVTPMEKKIMYSIKNKLVEIAEDGTGYIVNKMNTYPISLFLDLAWDIYASFQKKPFEECPVVFENFRMEHFLPAHLSEEDNIMITFESGSGRFEIITDHLLASGTVSLLKDKVLEVYSPEMSSVSLVGDEIYTEMKRKGYIIGKHFKSLSAVSFGKKELVGKIPQKTNWVHTIESLIQLFLLDKECSSNDLIFPRGFQRLEISSIEHKKFKNSLSENSSLTATYDPITNTAICGGIMLKGLDGLKVPKDKTSLNFPSVNFVPLMNPQLEDHLKFVDFCFSVALNSLGASKNLAIINVMEVTEPNQMSLGLYLQQLYSNFKVNVKTVTKPEVKEQEAIDFVISPLSALSNSVDHLVEGGFVFLKTSPGKVIPPNLLLIGRFLENSNEEYLLLKKKKSVPEECDFIVAEGSPSDLLNTLKDLKPSKMLTYVVYYKEPAEGIAQFQNRMQAETIVRLRWIFILDPKAPKFDRKNQFYAEQITKGLATNVYKNGSWGEYFEYNFVENTFQDDVNLSLEWSSEITPAYVSFSSTDDLLKLPQVEYSGTIKNSKVMGISSLIDSKKVEQDKYLMWEVPASWSLEDAASTPLSYALAYYCLDIVGRLQTYERVLVVDGMTCIGQASIAVALTKASRVFVTVKDQKEAALILKQFPQLKENDIISHERPEFYISWKLSHKKEYAEIIINTLEGPHFFSVLNCVGEYGRVFHFGKQEAEKNEQLGSSIFLMSLALHSKRLEVITTLSEKEKQTLHKLMLDGIKSGLVKPLPRVVLSFNEFKKIKNYSFSNAQSRSKTLLPVDTVKSNPDFVRFDTVSSYVVIGDESDVWIDVAEWLIDRRVGKIIIGYSKTTKRSELRLPHIKGKKNVRVYNHQDIEALIKEAQKLGPISAVFYLCLDSSETSKSLQILDQSYRNPKGHLMIISKGQENMFKLCATRNNSGFPTTNFIWDADQMLLNENLEFMSKICGRDSVIHVSPLTTFTKSEFKLVDLLPSTIDDFCDLGSSLQEEVRITPLETLTGVNRESVKEFLPLIFIPGLHKDPVKVLQPLVADFLYPAFCVEIPDRKLSVSRMASFILPEIVKLNKGGVFNIIGLSCGAHLAMELASQLEEIGAIVGLILIEGPFLNAKALVTKSLESDLLSIIQGYSKAGGSLEVQNEVISEKTWRRQLNRTLNVLNLTPKAEKDFCKAAIFVYNNLQALLNHDTTNINIKGPLTVIVSGQKTFDDKVIWKLSKSISIQCLSVSSNDLLNSKHLWKIIHGSAVSQAMSESTVHSCSWPYLEEFMTQKIVTKLGHDFETSNMKFSFTF